MALLLAAGGLLFAAQRPGRRGPLLLALAALLAAWLVRPGLAVVAYAAVLPATLRLAGGWPRARPLLLSAGLVLALAFGLAAWQQSPAEARVQARDARLARILDYEQLRPDPRTAADSLGTTAIGLWLLGDSAVVDPVLRGPVYRFDLVDFAGLVVPAKLKLRAGLLLRDYFPVLLALLATAGATQRQRRAGPRGFWLVQLAFALGLMGVAGILKLPPRLALPLLDCWLLTNLIFWLSSFSPETAPVAFGKLNGSFRSASTPSVSLIVGEGPEKWRLILPRIQRLLSISLLLAVSSLYAAKTWHRHRVLKQEQQQHEKSLAEISRKAGRVRVLAGTNDLLKSLSPLRTYYIGSGPVLQLTGWPALDPSQACLRQALTDTSDQAECLRRLARRVNPVSEASWFLTPATARWLNRHFRLRKPHSPVAPETLTPLAGSVSPMREYRVQLTRQP